MEETESVERKEKGKGEDSATKYALSLAEVRIAREIYIIYITLWVEGCGLGLGLWAKLGLTLYYSYLNIFTSMYLPIY